MGAEAASGTTAELDLAVPSMVCDGGAETIRTALVRLPGVREVRVSLWRKRVRVRYAPAALQPAQLTNAIVAAGFRVTDT